MHNNKHIMNMHMQVIEMIFFERIRLTFPHRFTISIIGILDRKL